MSWRKALFWVHLSLGVAAGIIILIMSVTGVLLAYQRQITAWADGSYRSLAPNGARRLSFEELLKPFGAANPPLTAVTLRSDPAASGEITFGRERVLFVDVYSGRVLGSGSAAARAFFQSVENWHRWLGAGDDHRANGRAITGACNLAFLVLVVSGPLLWIPRRWSRVSLRNIGWFRGGLSGRARDFNWHNAIGIWCALPLFLIVLSGVVMSYPWANNLLYRVTGNEPAAQTERQRPPGERRGRAAVANFSGMDVLWQRAERQVPEWRSITWRMGPSGRGPVTFTIDQGEGGRPDQRAQLTLDRRSGEVVRWEPFESYNAGRRWRSWFRFLHTGEAGGIAGESIAALATAGGSMLVWTGISLALRRLLRWKQRGRAPQPSNTRINLAEETIGK